MKGTMATLGKEYRVGCQDSMLCQQREELPEFHGMLALKVVT